MTMNLLKNTYARLYSQRVENVKRYIFDVSKT